MEAAGADVRDRRERGGSGHLVVRVIPPALGAPVAPGRARVRAACAHGGDIVESRRRRRLTAVVESPAHNRSVVLQRAGMEEARANVQDAGEAARNVRLAEGVVAPAGSGLILECRTGVIAAGTHARDRSKAPALPSARTCCRPSKRPTRPSWPSTSGCSPRSVGGPRPHWPEPSRTDGWPQQATVPSALSAQLEYPPALTCAAAGADETSKACVTCGAARKPGPPA